MNINIKKDETKTLRDKIINCEESLNAEEAVNFFYLLIIILIKDVKGDQDLFKEFRTRL